MIRDLVQNNKKKSSRRIGIAVFFIMVSMTLSLQANIFSDLNQQLKNPKEFIANNLELFHLLGCAMHLPYIFTADSSNEIAIRASAISSLVAIDSKLAYELFRTKTTCLAKELVYDLPKAGGYALSSVYDLIRCIDAEHVANKNQTTDSAQKMKSFKVSQLMKLVIEALLRALAYASSQNSSLINSTPAPTVTPAAQDNRFSFYLSELADAVELWRLLSRYTTYFTLSKVEANLNVVVQRESNPVVQAPVDKPELVGDKPALDEDHMPALLEDVSASAA